MTCKIKFTQPIPNVYLALFNNVTCCIIVVSMIDGKILDIELNRYYFQSLKRCLITEYVKYIGSDNVYARVDERYFDYYNELGFKTCNKSTHDTDYVVIKYEL